VAKYPRRIKLIRPGLQLRLTGTFVGLSALGLMLQAFVFMRELSWISAQLPNDGSLVLENVQRSVVSVLLISLVVLLPLTVWIGVLATHRIAGPAYRFEMFLRAVMRGERPADCRLRDGDELTDLCQTINAATAPLRAPSALQPGALQPGAASHSAASHSAEGGAAAAPHGTASHDPASTGAGSGGAASNTAAGSADQREAA
jgi:hypothetical protein